MTKVLMGRLVARRGPQQGESWNLVIGKRLTIGRSQENDLLIPDEAVSRRQAAISVKKDGMSFRNYSRNGSRVNDQIVAKGRPVTLQHGDVIAIGSCELLVNFHHEEDKTQILLPTAIMPVAAKAADKKAKNTAVAAKTSNVFKVKPMILTNALMPKLKKNYRDFKSKLASLEKLSFKTLLAKVGVGLLVLLGVVYLAIPSKKNNGKAVTDPTPANSEAVLLQGAIPDDSLKQALSLWGAAEKRFADRKLYEANLYDSIQKWEKGIKILGKYVEKPAEDYFVAVKHCEIAKELLERKYKNFHDAIVISENKNDYQSAKILLEKLRNSIPDYNDPRHRWVKDEENKIKPFLKPGLDLAHEGR